MTPVPPPGRPAAAARDLTKVHDMGSRQVTASDRVTFEILQGHFTAVMGPSGSGNYTLMRCLAGLDSPSSGAAWLGEVNLAQLPDRKLTPLRRDRPAAT
ncbi:ATP-binding cassette domain-containing protein [Streptomyces chrestomyceticus]|uniref:ATP-binding cassette domain-containing protein n=1 Tax=Streptomyces chrestomyceticus TaxID=68185 RepID=UPI0037B699C6